jgi:gliding motility-associated-like protein
VLTASGGGNYAWSTGANTPSITVDTTGTYTVVVSTVCGFDTASAVVTVADPIVAAITGDLTFCAGAITTLTALPSGGTYAWSTGSTDPFIVVSSPGSYSVTVSDGCTSGMASVNVTDYQMNVVAIASPLFGAAPLPVSFDATATPSASTWSWDFGDGGSAGAALVDHVFDTPGIYTVVVTATDPNGCAGFDTLIVEVVDTIPSQIIVPNVFSPNNDGQNDAFAVISAGLASLNVLIYDRWCKLIATIAKPDGRWNGRTEDGGEASEGTYFYHLLARGSDGRKFEQQGVITLLR